MNLARRMAYRWFGAEPDRVEGRVAEWVDHKRVVVAPAAAAASLWVTVIALMRRAQQGVSTTSKHMRNETPHSATLLDIFLG